MTYQATNIMRTLIFIALALAFTTASVGCDSLDLSENLPPTAHTSVQALSCTFIETSWISHDPNNDPYEISFLYVSAEGEGYMTVDYVDDYVLVGQMTACGEYTIQAFSDDRVPFAVIAGRYVPDGTLTWMDVEISHPANPRLNFTTRLLHH